jgi:hypothetical protein
MDPENLGDLQQVDSATALHLHGGSHHRLEVAVHRVTEIYDFG